ncbi:AAA family ATPase [bacterium]|jgi:flagellar biosynthesis protein FlhF|nr:AAA family ATPase [bacterium]
MPTPKTVIRKFQGSSYGAAKAKMIEELGEEGEILNVQQEGGFLGIFSGRTVLTVSPRKRETPGTQPKPAVSPKRTLDVTEAAGRDFLDDLNRSMGSELRRKSDEPESDSSIQNSRSDAKSSSSIQYSRGEANKLLEELLSSQSSFNSPRSQLSKTSEEPKSPFKLSKPTSGSPGELSTLHHEIKSLKDEFSALRTEFKIRIGSGKNQGLKDRSQDKPVIKSDRKESPQLTGSFQALSTILQKGDFASDVIEAHLELAHEHYKDEESPGIEELKEYVRKKFSKNLRIQKTIFEELKEKKKDGPRIMIFVGPTGVGKTTTMAKIASALILGKSPSSVAMITVDSFKLGAPAQVKEYAQGLNCPWEVVFRPEKLLPTIEKYKEKDVILIDTTGRGFRDKNHISSLKDFLPEELDTQTHLVLSATSRYQDLKMTISAFSRLSVDALLFTKIDETCSYGPMLSVLQMSLRSIGYITDGQNVPGHYSAATPSNLSELIFQHDQK